MRIQSKQGVSNFSVETNEQTLNGDTDASSGHRGAAINGSTLVTTFSDIRPFVERGATIFIDNTECKTSVYGEWTAGRIELAHDFTGLTNFNALISFSLTKKSAKTIAKKSPKPIESDVISRAVEGLDDFNKQYKAKG